MKNQLLILGLIGLMASSPWTSTAQSIKYRTGKMKHDMRKSVRRYQHAYAHSITDPTIAVEDSSMETLNDDGSTAFEVRAFRHIMYVNTNVRKTRPEFREEFSHELFHFLAPANPSPTLPFRWRGLYTAYAFRGLSIVMSGDKGSFDCIILEEACAETLAFPFLSKATAIKQPQGYLRVYARMQSMIDSGWLNANDAVYAQKNSDVYYLVGKITNQKTATSSDIILVLEDLFAHYKGSAEDIKEWDAKLAQRRTE